MQLRGIRGATTAGENSKAEILSATRELLSRMIAENKFSVDEIATAIFTVTADLDAEFPAVAARELGWDETPLLCANEVNVPGSLPKCIRVLLLVNTDKNQSEVKHIYLREATNLRK